MDSIVTSTNSSNMNHNEKRYKLYNHLLLSNTDSIPVTVVRKSRSSTSTAEAPSSSINNEIIDITNGFAEVERAIIDKLIRLYSSNNNNNNNNNNGDVSNIAQDDM